MSRIPPAPPEIYEPLVGANAPLVTQIHAVPEHHERAAILGAFAGSWMNDTLTISRRLVELMRLRIAFHNQCRSCMAMRYAAGAEAGVDETLVCSLEKPDEAPDLSDADRLALRYADLMATDHLSIDDAMYDGLREYYTNGEIVEIGQVCAFFVGFGRLDATWDLRDDLPEHFASKGAASEGGIVTPWGSDEVMAVGALSK
jgi:AhpD family alkylhydroperoxidase